MTNAFQHAFRAIGHAEVAFVADAAGEAPGSLRCVIQTHVYLVKRRATFLCRQGFALGNRLAFEQVQFHCRGANHFVSPDVHVTLRFSMSADLDLFAAQYIVNLHG